MDTKKRLLTIRLLEKMKENQEYSKELKLEDNSYERHVKDKEENI